VKPYSTCRRTGHLLTPGSTSVAAPLRSPHPPPRFAACYSPPNKTPTSGAPPTPPCVAATPVYIYIYIYTHIYVYIYMYVYMHMCVYIERETPHKRPIVYGKVVAYRDLPPGSPPSPPLSGRLTPPPRFAASPLLRTKHLRAERHLRRPALPRRLYIYIYIYTHIYVYIYMYVYMHMCVYIERETPHKRPIMYGTVVAYRG